MDSFKVKEIFLLTSVRCAAQRLMNLNQGIASASVKPPKHKMRIRVLCSKQAPVHLSHSIWKETVRLFCSWYMSALSHPGVTPQ